MTMAMSIAENNRSFRSVTCPSVMAAARNRMRIHPSHSLHVCSHKNTIKNKTMNLCMEQLCHRNRNNAARNSQRAVKWAYFRRNVDSFFVFPSFFFLYFAHQRQTSKQENNKHDRTVRQWEKKSSQQRIEHPIDRQEWKTKSNVLICMGGRVFVAAIEWAYHPNHLCVVCVNIIAKADIERFFCHR